MFFSPSWSTLTDTPDTCLTNPSSFIATFHKAEVTNNGSCMVVLSYQKPCPRKTFLSLELIQMGGHLLMKRRRVDAGRLEVKSVKTRQVRTTFGRSDAEKVHAVVARSTFRSKKCENTWASDDFWKFRCRKSARRCGAKHILSKNVKITTRSGHFWTIRLPFHVEKVHAVAARSAVGSELCQKLRVLSDFWCVKVVLFTDRQT